MVERASIQVGSGLATVTVRGAKSSTLFFGSCYASAVHFPTRRGGPAEWVNVIFVFVPWVTDGKRRRTFRLPSWGRGWRVQMADGSTAEHFLPFSIQESHVWF